MTNVLDESVLAQLPQLHALPNSAAVSALFDVVSECIFANAKPTLDTLYSAVRPTTLPLDAAPMPHPASPLASTATASRHVVVTMRSFSWHFAAASTHTFPWQS